MDPAEPAALTTEQIRPDLADLDLLPTAELLRVMNREDSAVPATVAGAIPSLAAAVNAIASRMAHGGRLS